VDAVIVELKQPLDQPSRYFSANARGGDTIGACLQITRIVEARAGESSPEG
jgi:hypothetical protein